MVVLMVGIPGVETGKLARSNGNLEFVAVESLGEAIAFLEVRACDTIMIGSSAADLAADRLVALVGSSTAAPEIAAGSASAETRSQASTRDRGDAVENVFRRGSIRDMERLMILDRLDQLNQNRTRSAESLEISVRTLRNKLRDYRTQSLIPVGAESESG